MSQLTLAEIKRYCQAVDFDDDDILLGELQAQAEDFVKSYTRRNLDVELPGAWPLGCTGAVKMLVAHWYDNRGGDADAAFQVPAAVRDLLAAHRDLS